MIKATLLSGDEVSENRLCHAVWGDTDWPMTYLETIRMHRHHLNVDLAPLKIQLRSVGGRGSTGLFHLVPDPPSYAIPARPRKKTAA